MKHTIFLSACLTILAGAHCVRIADKLLDESGSNTSGSTVSTTATRVYGQLGSFTSNTANNGGVTSNSLNRPTGIAVDSTGVYIVDNTNNRTLFFPGSSTTATRVYGQGGNLTTNAADNGGITANALNSPLGIGFDGAGLFISEGGYRTLYFTGVSTTATRVYGQSGLFTTRSTAVTANGLNFNYGVVHDGAGLYIADYGYHRVLYYAGTATTATRIYGQTLFTTNTLNNGGLSATSLNKPYGVTIDASGVYIGDTDNNRILYYAGTSTTATRVYGQGGSFTSNTANLGGISATSLAAPGPLHYANGGLYVSDSGNNRVLFFPGTSTTATKVYGQGGSFTTGTANNGGVSADSLNGPAGVFYYNGNLFIADYNNHRVLMY